MSARLAQSNSRPQDPFPSQAAWPAPSRPSPAPTPSSVSGSRLAPAADARSGWRIGGHEGAVVGFPEALTGQAQSFASVSSVCELRAVRAPASSGPAAAIDAARDSSELNSRPRALFRRQPPPW